MKTKIYGLNSWEVPCMPLEKCLDGINFESLGKCLVTLDCANRTDQEIAIWLSTRRLPEHVVNWICIPSAEAENDALAATSEIREEYFGGGWYRLIQDGQVIDSHKDYEGDPNWARKQAKHIAEEIAQGVEWVWFGSLNMFRYKSGMFCSSADQKLKARETAYLRATEN